MKMIYQDNSGPPRRTIEDVVRDGLPRDPDEDRDIARLLHDAMRHGQAQSAEVIEKARDRYYNDVKFSAMVKMTVGALDLHRHLDPDEHDVALWAAAVALVLADQEHE